MPFLPCNIESWRITGYGDGTSNTHFEGSVVRAGDRRCLAHNRERKVLSRIRAHPVLGSKADVERRRRRRRVANRLPFGSKWVAPPLSRKSRVLDSLHAWHAL